MSSEITGAFRWFGAQRAHDPKTSGLRTGWRALWITNNDGERIPNPDAGPSIEKWFCYYARPNRVELHDGPPILDPSKWSTGDDRITFSDDIFDDVNRTISVLHLWRQVGNLHKVIRQHRYRLIATGSHASRHEHRA